MVNMWVPLVGVSSGVHLAFQGQVHLEIFIPLVASLVPDLASSLCSVLRVLHQICSVFLHHRALAPLFLVHLPCLLR